MSSYLALGILPLPQKGALKPDQEVAPLGISFHYFLFCIFGSFPTLWSYFLFCSFNPCRRPKLTLVLCIVCIHGNSLKASSGTSEDVLGSIVTSGGMSQGLNVMLLV